VAAYIYIYKRVFLKLFGNLEGQSLRVSSLEGYIQNS